MEPKNPHTKPEIVAALGDLRNDGLRFWSDMDPDAFASPIGDAWSPADNVRHLVKSTRPVASALGMPRISLRALFGRPTGDSRSFAELTAVYRSALEGGATAGKFAPSPIARPADGAAWQRELVETLRSSVDDLVRATNGWNEADLDRYLLPHPLIGKLTLREMLFFTLYHFDHHARNVERRRAALREESAGHA